jgi:hypothetical protein
VLQQNTVKQVTYKQQKFLTALEARKSKMKALADPVHGKGPSSAFSLCAPIAEGMD